MYFTLPNFSSDELLEYISQLLILRNNCCFCVDDSVSRFFVKTFVNYENKPALITIIIDLKSWILNALSRYTLSEAATLDRSLYLSKAMYCWKQVFFSLLWWINWESSASLKFCILSLFLEMVWKSTALDAFLAWYYLLLK